MAEKKETKDKQIQTRFTWAEYDVLKKRAEEEGRTVSNLIHTATVIYLKNK